MDTIPTATGIVEGRHIEGNIELETNGLNPDSELKDSKNMPSESCIIFLIHFSPSIYFRCNFCFLLKEKALSETERFLMKFDELKSENNTLRASLDSTNNELQDTKTRLKSVEDTLATAMGTIGDLQERLLKMENLRQSWNVMESPVVLGGFNWKQPGEIRNFGFKNMGYRMPINQRRQSRVRRLRKNLRN